MAGGGVRVNGICYEKEGRRALALQIERVEPTPESRAEVRNLSLAAQAKAAMNGEVLLEKGAHTGSYPGRVLYNARYQAAHRGSA